MSTTPRTDAVYPCEKCGVMRTKEEGGTTFTLCDKCWNEEVGARLPPEVEIEPTIGKHMGDPFNTAKVRRLETELAEARAEVSRLKDELESHAWEISPAMAQAKIDQLNAEVERLRETLWRVRERISVRSPEFDSDSEIRAALDAARKQTP